jgi:hypothetical protein
MRTLLVQAANYTTAGRDTEKRVADAYFTIHVPAELAMYRQTADLLTLLQQTVNQMLPANSTDRYEVLYFEDYPQIEQLSTSVFMGLHRKMERERIG